MQSDDNLRQQFKEKWTPLASERLTEPLSQEIEKYRSILESAIKSDNLVKTKFDQQKWGIELLSKPENELKEAISGLGNLGDAQNSSDVNELRELVNKTTKIKAEREKLEQSFKDVSSHMSAEFLESMSEQVNKSIAEQEAIMEKVQACFIHQFFQMITVPPTTTSQSSSDLSETKETTSKSSEANTTLWIVIGVGIFFLLIVIIGFGYCCYRTQIQKKPLFGKEKDDQRKANILEASNKAIFAENEKNADEKKVLKPEKVVAKPEPSKESTAAKEKPPKPAKKKIPEKKAPIIVPKPSKEITQENGTKEDAPPAKKVSIEPTLENPTTEKSVVQQKQQPGNPSRASVSKKVILPAMNSDGFKSVSLFDTLSGAEDDETQHSTHASEKPRKNESAARKKGSKKHR